MTGIFFFSRSYFQRHSAGTGDKNSFHWELKKVTRTGQSSMATKKSSNPLTAMSAGCIAGAVEATCVWPMEFMKTQLQLGSTSGKKLPYNGVLQGLSYTVRTTGFFRYVFAQSVFSYLRVTRLSHTICSLYIFSTRQIQQLIPWSGTNFDWKCPKGRNSLWIKFCHQG